MFFASKGDEDERVEREPTKEDASWGGYGEGDAREVKKPKRAEGPDLD